jgi:hypothetical protein
MTGALVAVAILSSCADPSRRATDGDADSDTDSGTGTGTGTDGDADTDSQSETDTGTTVDLCDDGRSISIVRPDGTTAKQCQLTGDMDQHLGVPTSNRTEERFGLRKTDLGVSFEHDGGLFFFFGDSVDRWDGFVGDAMATSRDDDPADCIDLDFPLNGFGQFLAPVVPGITLDGCEVPMEGLSLGGSIYGFFTTDAAAGCDMGRSVVARSDDGGATWENLYDLSASKFINVSAVDVPAGEVPGLEGEQILVFGSGPFRRSDLSLAIVAPDEIDDRAAWRFFEATDPETCAPRFGDSEDAAAALLGEDCIGELSVFFAPGLDRWVLLYGCDEPRGIVYRVARWPWGPWSEARALFDPFADGGYCVFMHQPGCDGLDDPAPGEPPGHWGGEYAPYVVPTSLRDEPDAASFHFAMSTWNPYQVVLMRSRLEVE